MSNWLRKRPLLVYCVVQSVLILAAVTSASVDQYRYGHHYTNSIMPYIGSLFNQAGLIAICCVLFHSAYCFQLNEKQRVLTTVALILLYVSSYAVLSCCGKYHASRSGTHRWKGIGLSMVDQDLWHARGVFWQPFVTIDGKHTFQASLLGWFYSPLVCLDRALVHKSVSLFEQQ